MIQMYFGKACKEYREEMNISQEKFALSIGMDNLLVQFCILLNVQVIIFLKYKLFFLNISYPRNGIGSISLSFPNGTGERFKKKLPSGVSIL